MNADPHSGPRDRERLPHRGAALALAIAVHLAFLAVLVFSLRWQSHEPEPVTAELYAPIAQPAKVTPVPPRIQPLPTPASVPKVAPVPPPPQPIVEPPKVDTAAADIAMKAKRDEERRERVEAEQRAQAEQQKRIADLQKQRELQKLADKKLADDRKLADARERQQREMTQMQAQADNELQQRANAETAARAQEARKSAESDWIQRIQAKVKGNVILPPDLAGNPEAIFDVVQLPTGEIIDVKLQKSSGVRSYDDSVQRAILKSSPLPKPDRPEMFQRVLTLRFRPND